MSLRESRSEEAVEKEAAGGGKGEAGIGIAIATPFLFWLYQYINLDFWYDEVWSLLNYSFAPLSRTVTDYAVPNNHIFFNLINNLYLRCVGEKSLYALMDHPYVIRLLPLCYTLLTLFYVHRIGRRYFDRLAAWVSVIVLVTTVPYYNFALQVRGYGLSTLLLCAVWYHGWGLEERFGRRDSILSALGTALSLYTLPSNLYFLAGTGAFYLALGVWDRSRSARPKVRKGRPVIPADRGDCRVARWQALYDRSRYFYIVFLMGIGVLTAVLLYLPVIGGVAGVASGKNSRLFYVPTLSSTLPTVFYYFLSHRYLFLPVVAVGFYFALFKGADPRLARRLMLCLTLLVLPFVFCFVKGDQPPDRIFVVLTPVFAVVVAVCASHFFRHAVPGGGVRGWWVVLGLVFLYCNVTFAFCIDRVHQRLRENLDEEKKAQDLYYNYYQAYYHPLRVIGDFARPYQRGLQPGGSLPVLVCEGDALAFPQYLKKFHIAFYSCDRVEKMKGGPDKAGVFVITFRDVKRLFQKDPHFECERLSGEADFCNFFLLVYRAL